jgi:UDP-glucuronate decarboxylase
MRAELISTVLAGHERFAVTGASGWLGRTTLDVLLEALGPEGFHDRVTGFASAAKPVTLHDGTLVDLLPLARLIDLRPAPTHLLHFAYLTRDRVADLGVAAYVETNVAITACVVGAIERLRPEGVFSTSSGAVYTGHEGALETDVCSDPYASLKHLEELAIRRAAADVGGRSVVSRVFSLTGPYMTKPGLYALGDFVLQALGGGPIVVRSPGPVERSYCSAADLVALALACLFDGTDADVVFDSGGDRLELGDLARLVTEVIGPSDSGIERAWDPELPADRYVAEGDRMEELASMHGLRLEPIRTQIRRTATYLEGLGRARR